jgi:type II secretory ATPase GspE/PulE/Tfp pilus assembly ATPase PilB-like protein
MAVIQVLTPSGTRVLELPSGPITIGRSSKNDIVIDDPKASRQHCLLQPAGGGYLLKDMNSRNGVKVDGQQVTEVMIPFGHAFVIGATVLRLFEHEVPPVEIVEAEETAVDAEAIEAPVAPPMEEDTLQPVDDMSSSDRVLMAARRDLNNLRTCGMDPGFRLQEVTLLDCHGRVVHAGEDTVASSEAVRTFRLLFFGAFRTRATDMHIDVSPEGCSVRFRVDGKMLPMATLPIPIGRAILGVVKVLCELDIAGRKTIQDGSFSVETKRHVDCRVSMTPTAHGTKLVIRILDTSHVPHVLEDLGLTPVMLRQVRSAVHLDSGMIVVSGPTGSGKTTTLYTALQSMDVASRNVITIEDPIEYHLKGVTQMQVDTHSGLTFSHLLKSVLRQDPDVILVGEIRDKETAQTAMQAAMTGHLVYTTLHARDAIGSIFRLLDLGVEPYMVANAVSLCLAQRLIRVLCQKCKKGIRPQPSHLVKMGAENKNVKYIYTYVGCRRCMNVGFWGRTAIFELLSFNDNLRDALMTTKTIHDIRRAAGEWSYSTLLESGYRKVVDGITTMEEVEHVAARE